MQLEQGWQDAGWGHRLVGIRQLHIAKVQVGEAPQLEALMCIVPPRAQASTTEACVSAVMYNMDPQSSVSWPLAQVAP